MGVLMSGSLKPCLDGVFRDKMESYEKKRRRRREGKAVNCPVVQIVVQWYRTVRPRASRKDQAGPG